MCETRHFIYLVALYISVSVIKVKVSHSLAVVGMLGVKSLPCLRHKTRMNEVNKSLDKILIPGQ